MEPGRFQNVAMTLVGLSLVAVKCRNIEIERGWNILNIHWHCRKLNILLPPERMIGDFT